ncbi:hypothetical protein HPULCUR_006507 [Helicostylum pulchrum]|uniref:Tuberin N-terminal domain-containing protein n=1 Tax=Helicostylum pulchrum TaxID=562976 RepID=A0ABP9Y3G0_9FUNG
MCNHWLSNILRPRASSISVESCLNIPTSDPTTPLDARPILPLLDSSQPLSSRIKHLAVFSEICKSYKLTHLENVFFTVQDVLDPTMPREARHVVFNFMLACIIGQYTDLGMARVTFYSSLRNYNNWDDFADMYKVLFALCKEGRDISGFEKNISKLLIHWLDIAIVQQRSGSSAEQPIPYLSDILHLLTLVAKFNFALFEEDEVTRMIDATHKAFFSSNNVTDMKACLEFADIVVRYRFVPFHALTQFLDILAASVEIQKTGSSAWPIFLNLLRSHCAHSAILTLCKFLDKTPSIVDKENILIKGAIILLGETAWGKNSRTGADTYMVSDSVIIMYLRRAATKGNDAINGTILNILILLIEDTNESLSLMEWEAVWDIVDVCTRHIIRITDNNSNNDLKLFDNVDSYPITSCIYQFSRFSKLVMHQTKGPLIRWIGVLYQLRAFCSDETAKILLDYYVTEHSFLPSTDNWLSLLEEVTDTFYIHTTTVSSAIRLKMLGIVYDVCDSVKDFYSEVMYTTIVIPMMKTLHLETDIHIRQTAIDLLVSSLSDCQSVAIFEQLIDILRSCAQCQCTTVPTVNEESTSLSNPRVTSMRMPTQIHRNTSSSSSIPTVSTSSNKTFVTSAKDSIGSCMGISAMCGITELFENLLLASNAKLCSKTFDIIAEIANDEKDLACPYGGPKIVALDLLLRFRCPTNHHLYLIDDSKFSKKKSYMCTF